MLKNSDRVHALAIGLLVVALGAGVLGSPPVTAGSTRPNIVVIMVDDQPEMGLRLLDRTPAIRSTLARRGLHFTRFYGNDPLCCPGRANFLTGLYSHHHGVTNNHPAGEWQPTETVATALNDAGYYTMIAGKYFNETEELDPTPPGWDRAAVYSGGYYRYRSWVNGRLRYNGSTSADYSTDVFRDRSLRFLRRAPVGSPIFALLTPYATHHASALGHYPPAPRHEGDARCADVGAWKPASYNEKDMSDKPLFMQDDAFQVAGGWPLQDICESMLSVDDWFAAVRAELVHQGRFNNTLFVYTADNGMAWGRHRQPAKINAYATEMPLLMRWPAVTGDTARDVSVTASNVDLAPTFVELAGADPLGPYPTGQLEPDGVSLVDVINGGGIARDAILEEHRVGRAFWAIRTDASHPLGRFHYISYDSGYESLFDLSVDPDEMDSVHADPSYADTKAALAAELEVLRSP